MDLLVEGNVKVYEEGVCAPAVLQDMELTGAYKMDLCGARREDVIETDHAEVGLTQQAEVASQKQGKVGPQCLWSRRCQGDCWELAWG